MKVDLTAATGLAEGGREEGKGQRAPSRNSLLAAQFGPQRKSLGEGPGAPAFQLHASHTLYSGQSKDNPNPLGLNLSMAPNVPFPPCSISVWGQGKPNSSTD